MHHLEVSILIPSFDHSYGKDQAWPDFIFLIQSLGDDQVIGE